jgi:hypothetical protein
MPLAMYARIARHPLLRACHRAHIVSGATSQNTASSHASNDEARESWDGLLAWRSAAPDARTRWGDKQQPIEPEPQATPSDREPDDPATAGSLADYARLVLSTRGADDKRQLSHAAWMHYRAGGLPVGFAEPPDRPARPDRPEVRHGWRRRRLRRRLPSSRGAAGALPAPLLHDPHPSSQLVPARRVPAAGSPGCPLPLNAAVLHNLAHIELNAIDLVRPPCPHPLRGGNLPATRVCLPAPPTPTPPHLVCV